MTVARAFSVRPRGRDASSRRLRRGTRRGRRVYKFAEWTRDGKLRQPVFLGIREDKNATEVVRESAGR